MREIDIRLVNLNLLPALEALIVEQSVSAAARRMNVTQSAMSHSLARLRELLGDPILVASGKRFTRSPHAERIAAELSQALDRLGDAVRSPERFEPRTASRSFRVATVDLFEIVALPATLRYLAEHAPSVDVVIERFSPARAPMVAAGEIALALGGDPPGLPATGLCRAPFAPVGFSVIARKGHPAARALRRASLEAYLEHGHVLVSLGEGRVDGVVDRELARRGCSRRVVVRIPSFVTAPLVVLATDHLATVPTSVALRARELFDLEVFEPPVEIPPKAAVAYWSRRLDHDPANQWLREVFIGPRAPWRRPDRRTVVSRGADIAGRRRTKSQ